MKAHLGRAPPTISSSPPGRRGPGDHPEPQRTRDRPLRVVQPRAEDKRFHRARAAQGRAEVLRARSRVRAGEPAAPDLFTKFTLPPSHTRQVNPPLSFADGGPVFQFRIADYTEEDYDSDGRVQAMGFVGEHSEMAWLYRLKRDLDQDILPIKETPERPAISSVNYFQDDSELSVLDPVDLTRWPPQHVADNLVDAYFHVVHPAFPIFGKTTFLHQYRYFYSNPNSRPGKKWLALLNLVFAIATRHLLLADQPWPNYDDHQTFFARAWSVSIGQVAFVGTTRTCNRCRLRGWLLSIFCLLGKSIGQSSRGFSVSLLGVLICGVSFLGLGESMGLRFDQRWQWV